MLCCEKEFEGDNYIYKEGYISSKIYLSINGVECEKIKTRIFKNPEKEITYKIRGDYVRGIDLITSEGKKIELIKNKWFHYLIIFLPFIFVVGVIGGWIGGAIAGAIMAIDIFINAMLLRLPIKKVYKVLSIIGVFLISILLWVGLFILCSGGFDKAISSLTI